MKIFFFKAALLMSLVGAIYLIAVVSYDPLVDIENSFLAATIDKHERLENSGEGRLVLLGGSNMAFSIDSKYLEERFGRKVVNMGLGAGLGSKYMINEAIPAIRQGDVIVLSLEYQLFDPEYQPDVTMIESMQLIYPPAKEYYHLSWKESLKLSFEHFRRTFRYVTPSEDKIYSRKAFNAQGDVVSHLDWQGEPPHLEDALPDLSTLGDVDHFVALRDKCIERKARLMLIFPPYPKSLYQSNGSKIERINELIRRELSGIQVLGSPQVYLVNDEDMFDMIYHLNEGGRRTRTAILINELTKVM